MSLRQREEIQEVLRSREVSVKFHRDFAPGELLETVLANQAPIDNRLKELADAGHKRGKRVLIMLWDQTAETSRKHLEQVAHEDLQPLDEFFVISSPVDAGQLKAVDAAYGKKWGPGLFVESWPVFCILDVDGSTLAVKNTREFAKQSKVDDSLVNWYLKPYAGPIAPMPK